MDQRFTTDEVLHLLELEDSVQQYDSDLERYSNSDISFQQYNHSTVTSAVIKNSHSYPSQHMQRYLFLFVIFNLFLTITLLT